MFGHSTEIGKPQLDPTHYLKDMTRQERYEWENYEIPSLERLEKIIKVVQRGLQVDVADKPGVEKDLLELELVQEQAEGIMNRCWYVAAAAGLLPPVIVGIAAGVATGGGLATGFGIGGICAIPSFIALVPFSQMASKEFIFTPLANRFIDKQVKL